MSFSRFLTGIAASTAAVFFLSQPVQAENPSIVDIATSNSDFSSLVDALVSQDLVSTLQSPGPFTVFAPTNDAFARLPRYVGKALENNPSLLTDILLAHVVPGTIRSSDIGRNSVVETVGGNSVRARKVGNNVYVHRSKVTAADIEASNGIVHVVNRVIIPRDLQRTILRSRLHHR